MHYFRAYLVTKIVVDFSTNTNGKCSSPDENHDFK